ncbi:dehydrogenase [Actinomycetota bacterium]|nr:dehydrogenase [Actinomycetota bacterium]
MSETGVIKKGITRRSFLKTTAAVGGVAALSGTAFGCSSINTSAKQTAVQEQVFATTCQGNCHGFCCPFDVYVNDGKVVNIKKFIGNPEFEAVCQRGYSNIERMYSPLRIKAPMRRVGERGAGEWEQITWDEAIEEICSKWKSYRSEFGNGSIIFSRGSGSFNMTTAYWDRLVNYLNASNLAHHYDSNGVYSAFKHLGIDKFSKTGNEFRVVKYAKNIVVWGANPTESATIAFHYISEARENGAQLIVIDPNFTTTAAKADKFITIRPGSDGLLAIGIMQIVAREGLQDNKFLIAKTVAPFLVKESDGKFLRQSDIGQGVAGSKSDLPLVCNKDGVSGSPAEVAEPVIEGSFEINGFKVTTAYSLLLERINLWSLEEICEKTTVPLETIEWLAKRFVDGPTSVVTGYGMDHWVNGITGYTNILSLLDMTGNQAKPGAGLSIVDLSVPIAQGPVTTAIAAPSDAKPGSTLPGAYLYDVIKDGSKGNFKETIKSAYFYCHNIIGNYPDRKNWLEIFDSIEFIVTADIWMSETATYSDLVLPVTFIWESEDIARKEGNPYLRLMEKVVEPQFEAKSDFDIANLLAKGMDLDSKFGMEIDDFLALTLDNDDARSYGITWSRLKEEKRIWAYPDKLYCQGEAAINTPTGRFEFYQEGIKPMFDYGQNWDVKRESLPYWFPPNEAWYENESIKKYPLTFTSERSKFKVHTMFTYTPMLLEIDPEPYVKVSQEDADARSIQTGDIIKLYNDRGYVVIKAVINPGVRPGVLVIDHGWQGNQFIEGHYSDLSNRIINDAIPGPAWFDTLCEIEKKN